MYNYVIPFWHAIIQPSLTINGLPESPEHIDSVPKGPLRVQIMSSRMLAPIVWNVSKQVMFEIMFWSACINPKLFQYIFNSGEFFLLTTLGEVFFNRNNKADEKKANLSKVIWRVPVIGSETPAAKLTDLSEVSIQLMDMLFYYIPHSYTQSIGECPFWRAPRKTYGCNGSSKLHFVFQLQQRNVTFCCRTKI